MNNSKKSLTYLFGLCLLASVSILLPKSVSAAAISWTGGSGAWETGSNWSGSSVPDDTDDVTIDATVTVTINATTTINSLTLGGSNSPTLTFDYDAITGTALIIDDGNVTVNSGATITHTDATNATVNGTIDIDVQTGNFTLTGNVDIDDIGNDGGAAQSDGYGTGKGTYVFDRAGGGGGYGGAGGTGTNSGGIGGSSYGSLTAPSVLGSGGGGGQNDAGGDGGGAIKLTVNGTLTVAGTIDADGQAGFGATRHGGGGLWREHIYNNRQSCWWWEFVCTRWKRGWSWVLQFIFW